MTAYLLSEKANADIVSIYRYTKRVWGESQADTYLDGLYQCFDAIVSRQCLWQPIAADYGVTGYFTRHKKHYIYWRTLSQDRVGIVTVLHERMHRVARLNDLSLPEDEI